MQKLIRMNTLKPEKQKGKLDIVLTRTKSLDKSTFVKKSNKVAHYATLGKNSIKGQLMPTDEEKIKGKDKDNDQADVSTVC